jgi:hypothetical protein
LSRGLIRLRVTRIKWEHYGRLDYRDHITFLSG